MTVIKCTFAQSVQAITGWNQFIAPTVTGVLSSDLLDDTDTSTGVSLTLNTAFTAALYSSNISSSVIWGWEEEVWDTFWYSNVNGPKLSFGGLTPGDSFTLYIAGATRSAGRNTTYDATNSDGPITYFASTTATPTEPVLLTGVVPAGGVVDISMTLASVYLYLTGFVLTVTPAAATDPTITDIDTDEDIYPGQTTVALTGTDLGATAGTIRLNSQSDGLGINIAQTVTGTWTDTTAEFTVVQGNLPFGTVYAFIKTAALLENAAGFPITLSPAAGKEVTIYTGPAPDPATTESLVEYYAATYSPLTTAVPDQVETDIVAGLSWDGSWVPTLTTASSVPVNVRFYDVTEAAWTVITVETIYRVPILTLPNLSNPTDTILDVSVTTDVSIGTAYLYVSTSITPPSAADIISGLGADWHNGGVTVTAVGTITDTALGLAGGTTYYLHAMHDNNGGYSDIVTSAGTATTAAITGTASGILSGIIGAASGTYTPLPITGTADCVVSAITGSAAGTFTAFAISGTASGILAAITAAAAGTSTPLAITGSGDAVLTSITADATGNVASLGISGSGSGLLEVVLASGSGTFTPLAITGSADAVLASVTADSSGTFTPLAITGAVDAVLSAITADATGSYSNADFIGTGAGTLTAVNASASGVLSSSGVVSGLLSAITSSAEGLAVNNTTGTAQGVLSAIVASGLGNIPIVVTGTASHILVIGYEDRTIVVQN